jgi:DivIVA domain-containing protein
VLTPEQIESREFLVSVRGYDRDEVHAFLREVAETARALHEQAERAVLEQRAAEDLVAEAEARAERERQRADQATKKVQEAQAQTPSVVAPADAAGLFAEIGSQTQRILEAAAQAADEIKAQAKREAEQEIRKARRQADKLVAEGERRREELERGMIELARKREEVGTSLRAVARGLEQSLRDLTLDEPAAATMREAMVDEARVVTERAVQAERPAAAAAPAPTGGATEAAVEPPHDAAPQASVRDEEPAQAEAAPAVEPGDVRGEALVNLQPKIVRKVKRGLQDLQNIALERLRSTNGAGEPADLLPPDEEFAALVEGAGEFLDQAYLAGLQAGAAKAGSAAPELAPPAELRSDFLAEISTQVNEPLSATLRMGVSAREPLPSLSDRVGGVFGELRQSAAEDLASAHLLGAFEAGMLQAWAAAGIPARRWVLGREPRCPEGRCRTNDQGGPVALDHPFPSGHAHPPVHMGCTCTTEPLTAAG